MHVEAELLDGISDVRPCEGEVLKCASKTPVGGGVCWSKHRTPSLGQLALGVHRCRAGLAGGHPGSLQNVTSELPLVEEQTGRSGLNSDAEEVVEHPKILHSKFLLE
jgi:hypothetical protein